MPTGRPRTLAEVVRGGLCTGCGLCVSLSGGRLEMRLSARGDLRPAGLEALSDQESAGLVDVCPGATVVGPDPALEDGTVLEPVWGPVRAMHRGWAADPAVRHRASAGGVLTALAGYLLESGQVAAVLHVRPDPDRPLLTQAQVSRDAEQVLAGAQSRYGPAAPLVHVTRLLDDGERFAVVAKPCDLTAVRNLARCDRRVDEQVRFLLTNFCGGIPSVRMVEGFAAAQGIKARDVTLLRFRGEGWPGPTRVEAADGRAAELSYRQAYLDPSTRLPYDAQWRCKICPDAVGEVADVSVPDGWVLGEDGRPVHDDAPGVNVVLERTARGSALVRDAVRAGYLELAPLSRNDFEAMHHDHHRRRLGGPARLAALRAAGAAEPRVEGYRLEQLVALAPPELLATQHAGTLRRLQDGQGAERIVP